jgi:O-methyltransferase involved in polyketide biosynthesis
MNRKTLILWEGVVPYLTSRVVMENLMSVSLLCPGSKIVFDYVEERKFNLKARFAFLWLYFIGEPMLSAFSLTSLKSMLTECNLAIENHVGGASLPSNNDSLASSTIIKKEVIVRLNFVCASVVEKFNEKK